MFLTRETVLAALGLDKAEISGLDGERQIRCAYCEHGSEHRLMIGDGAGRFICVECGHVTRLTEPEFRCYCDNCHDAKLFHRSASFQHMHWKKWREFPVATWSRSLPQRTLAQSCGNFGGLWESIVG
jgi:hypothetical protein